MNVSLIRETLPTSTKNCWWLQQDGAFTQGNDEAQLLRRLTQYFELPLKIVSIFKLAQQQLDPSSAVRAELEDNVQDELGARTAGVVHVVILKRQLERELGLDFTGRTVETATSEFLKELRETIRHSAGSAAGVSYALESTAIAELKTVATLINRLASLRGLSTPIDLDQQPQVLDDAEKIDLSSFFCLHVGLIEHDHEHHLADAILADAPTEQQFAEIEFGFRETLAVLDRWFTAIR